MASNLQKPENAEHEKSTAQDHAIWDTLFDRQAKLLPGRASREFPSGLNGLRMERSGIPPCDDLSRRLLQATGWQVVAVPGHVPDDVIFEHLADRRFVSGNFTHEGFGEGNFTAPFKSLEMNQIRRGALTVNQETA